MTWHALVFVAFIVPAVLLPLTLGFFIRKERQRAGGEHELPPVSVVVAAHNEEDHLPSLLSALDRQDYPSHLVEFVLVNDRSTDNTQEILHHWAKSNPNAVTIRIMEARETMSPKRFALQTGIAAARHDALLLTDADCLPPSTWIREMARTLDSADTVIGLSPVETSHGALSLFTCYENLRTQALMAGMAAAGMPYMAVGRNIAYQRQAYDKAGKHQGTAGPLSGDDDLLVQNMAKQGLEIHVNLQPGGVVPTRAPTSWKDFFRRKQRHFSASRRYSIWPGWIPALWQAAESISLVCGLYFAATGKPLYAVSLLLPAAALVFFVQPIRALFASTGGKNMSRTIPALLAPILEPVYLIVSPFLFAFGIFRKAPWK